MVNQNQAQLQNYNEVGQVEENTVETPVEYKANNPYEVDDYLYPVGVDGKAIDLRPNTTATSGIIRRLEARANLSNELMMQHRVGMKAIQDKLKAYAYLDEDEQVKLTADARKPTTIVVPFMSATLETLLTYWTSALVSDPIFTYTGAAPEDEVGAKLLEIVMAQHARKSKMGLNIRTMARDALVYGFAPVLVKWSKFRRKQLKVVGDIVAYDALGVVQPENMKREALDVFDEYNVLENIDPLRYLPDPAVPINDVQASEFIGWTTTTSRNALIQLEAMNPNSFFNCRYIPLDGCRSSLCEQIQDRPSADGLNSSFDMAIAPVDLLCMFVNLIPAQWGLGNSMLPEKWSFVVAGNDIIIQARPLDEIHQKYPVCICAPTFDGHSLVPTSTMELVYGLQVALDWLFNSRMQDVEKCIEGGITLYNPDMVNTADLLAKTPHKYVKMKNRGLRNDPASAVYQVPVREVTTGNISDMDKILNLGSNITGASDTLQGVMKKVGERVTAEQVASTKASALNRIEAAVTIASVMTMSDLGYMCASNIQQYIEDSQWISTLGRWTEDLVKEYNLQDKFSNGKVQISPLDLVVDFDVIPKDASTAKSDNIDLLLNLLGMIAQSPILSQQYDFSRLVSHAARLAGVKNLEDFKIVIKETNPQQQQQGNPVALEGGITNAPPVPA